MALESCYLHKQGAPCVHRKPMVSRLLADLQHVLPAYALPSGRTWDHIWRTPAGRTEELAGEVDLPPQRVAPGIVASLALGLAQHETRRDAEFRRESLDSGEVALKRQARDVLVRDE